MQHHEWFPSFLRRRLVGVFGGSIKRRFALTANVDPEPEKAVLKVAITLLGCGVPELLEKFKGIGLFVGVVHAVEKQPSESATPIVIGLVDLLEHLVDLFEDIDKEFLPVGSEHGPNDIVNANAGIVYEEAVFNFIFRLADDFNCFLDVG